MGEDFSRAACRWAVWRVCDARCPAGAVPAMPGAAGGAPPLIGAVPLSATLCGSCRTELDLAGFTGGVAVAGGGGAFLLCRVSRADDCEADVAPPVPAVLEEDTAERRVRYKDSAPRSRWRHRRQTMELYGCGVPLTGSAPGSGLGPPLRGGFVLWGDSI